MLRGFRERPVPGNRGIVKDGILQGFYAYKAGQSCVWDHFSWFIENCQPASYTEEAEAQCVVPYELLCEKAERPDRARLVQRRVFRADGLRPDREGCSWD